MLKADLHTHSSVSDGSTTIEEIIRLALQKGLGAVAITDHDTLSHLTQIPELKRIKVIGGIEISAKDHLTGIKAHILGYHIQNIDLVEEFVRPLVKSRHTTCLKQMDILTKHGFTFDEDKMLKADGKYIYKQHIMEYLVRTGQAPDLFGAFYKTTFKNNGICQMEMDYADAAEAVRVVKSAGGQAVLAHPGQQKNYYLIPDLVQCGLDGLEYNHPSNGAEDHATIRRIADEYGLYLTGGSDFHGVFEEPVMEVGDYISEESGISALCLE